MTDTITKDTNLRDLLTKYPDSAKVFAAYGIGCIGCALASYETLGEGITAHGIDVDEFLKDLNSYVGESN
jgi:hybrid cluster-associated redox disulfide protein